MSYPWDDNYRDNQEQLRRREETDRKLRQEGFVRDSSGIYTMPGRKFGPRYFIDGDGREHSYDL